MSEWAASKTSWLLDGIKTKRESGSLDDEHEARWNIRLGRFFRQKRPKGVESPRDGSGDEYRRV